MNNSGVEVHWVWRQTRIRYPGPGFDRQSHRRAAGFDIVKARDAVDPDGRGEFGAPTKYRFASHTRARGSAALDAANGFALRGRDPISHDHGRASCDG